MESPQTCQSCQRDADASRLEYRRGDRVIRNGALLQCDVCERLACADCMGVYDLLSGYDFLCRDCAREIDPPRLRALITQNQPARPSGLKELAAPPGGPVAPRPRALDS
jgi:hypothetical protein